MRIPTRKQSELRWCVGSNHQTPSQGAQAVTKQLRAAQGEVRHTEEAVNVVTPLGRAGELQSSYEPHKVEQLELQVKLDLQSNYELHEEEQLELPRGNCGIQKRQYI